MKPEIPLECVMVLDAMTDANWSKYGYGGYEFEKMMAAKKLCFINRAEAMGLDGLWLSHLSALCMKRHGASIVKINESARSLSEFKSKVEACYSEK